VGTTTLAYAIAKNEFGAMRGIVIVLVALAVLLDLGVLGGGAPAEARRRRRVGGGGGAVTRDVISRRTRTGRATSS
jgi:hypothetical protein